MPAKIESLNEDKTEKGDNDEQLLIQLDDDNAVDMPESAKDQNDNNTGWKKKFHS